MHQPTVLRLGLPRHVLAAVPLALATVAVGFAMVDLFLAFAGGMLIGLTLGYWILPRVVDAIDAEDLADRLRRIPRRRGR